MRCRDRDHPRDPDLPIVGSVLGLIVGIAGTLLVARVAHAEPCTHDVALRVTVDEWQDDEPDAGAIVEAERDGFARQHVRADRDGIATLRLAQGTWRVRAWQRGGASPWGEITLWRCSEQLRVQADALRPAAWSMRLPLRDRDSAELLSLGTEADAGAVTTTIAGARRLVGALPVPVTFLADAGYVRPAVPQNGSSGADGRYELLLRTELDPLPWTGWLRRHHFGDRRERPRVGPVRGAPARGLTAGGLARGGGVRCAPWAAAHSSMHLRIASESPVSSRRDRCASTRTCRAARRSATSVPFGSSVGLPPVAMGFVIHATGAVAKGLRARAGILLYMSREVLLYACAITPRPGRARRGSAARTRPGPRSRWTSAVAAGCRRPRCSRTRGPWRGGSSRRSPRART